MNEREKAFNEAVREYLAMHQDLPADVELCGGLETFTKAVMAAGFNSGVSWVERRIDE